MKRSTCKIGSENARQVMQDGKRVSINHFLVEYNEPETVADCLQLAQGNEAVVVKNFKRGYVIKIQDSIGRAMWEAGESQEAIQREVDAFVLGVTKAKGRPATPKVVAVPKDKKSFSPAEVEAMLAKAGIKTVAE